MGHDAAYLVCMVELNGMYLVIVATVLDWRFEGVDLSEQTHCRVVKETAYDSGAFDEPVYIVVSSKNSPYRDRYFLA